MTAITETPETTTLDNGLAAKTAEIAADALNAHGFDVRNPAQQGSSILQVTNVRGALCELVMCGSGVFDWEYRSLEGSQSDPSRLAAMAMCILSVDRAADSCVPVAHNRGVTLKGQIGRALADQGMHVSLNVLDTDELFFEVYSEVAITNPARPDRGTVCVADDGLLWWRGQVRNADHREDGLDLADITDTLTRTLLACTV